MLERAEELKQRIRETPLDERLDNAKRRIGRMCSEGRPPRMTIPVQYDDDDFFISTTLADAQATIADLQGQVKDAQEGLSLCEHELGSVRIDRAILQQRVAQLEGEIKRYAGCGHDHSTAWWQLRYEDLQADHARVLGLVEAATKLLAAKTTDSFHRALSALESATLDATTPATPTHNGGA